MRYRSLVLVLLIVVGASAPVLAQESGEVIGRPGLSVTAADNHFSPGQRAVLNVTVSNDGLLIRGGPVKYEERVTTARNVVLEIRSSELRERYGDAIQVDTGPVALGNVPPGAVGPISFSLEIGDSIDPGRYEIPVRLSYQYTNFVEYSSTEATEYRDVNRWVRKDVTIVIEDQPRFVVRSVDSDVFVDDAGTMTVSMTNVGTRKALNARVTVRSGNPSVTVDGSQAATMFLDSWSTGETKNVTVPVRTAPGIVPREYSLSVQTTYETTNGLTARGETRTVGLSPSSGHRFEVVNATAEVAVGERGPLAVTLRNRGGVALERATVLLESASPSLQFDGQAATAQFVGSWGPGETRTVVTDVRAPESADTRNVVVDARVQYEYGGGRRAISGPYDIGVTLAPEQSFTFENTAVTLRGDTAILTGRVRNTGSIPIQNTVVLLESAGPSISVREPTSPVGTLEPGESARTTFDLRVSPDASPGPRQFQARLRYDRGTDRTYTTDSIPVRATFRTERELFSLEPVNATFGIDTSNRFRVRITNTGEETYRDVRARLTGIAPYESAIQSSYAGTLAPGESAMLVFEVTTPEDSVPTTDSLTLNVTAESPQSQTITAGPYQVPVTIAGAGPTSGNLLMLAGGAIVVLVLLGIGWWWLNQ
ncbi:MAG: COG1361 S-layer family protein [Halodesulfurarchaeum sp.]